MRRTPRNSLALKVHGAPERGLFTIRSRARATALSQRFPRREFARSLYQSACSIISFTAASLRLIRDLFTGAEFDRATLRPSLFDEDQRREFRSLSPLPLHSDLVRECAVAALYLGESVPGRIRWACPNPQKPPALLRIVSTLPGARCSTTS